MCKRSTSAPIRTDPEMDDSCCSISALELRDAYLQPWGSGHNDALALAIRAGAFAHIIAWMRQRAALSEGSAHGVQQGVPIVLRRAISRTVE